MRVLLIDNNDSFTWNIVELLRRSAVQEFEVLNNESVSPAIASGFDKIIISPGPGIPKELPNVTDVIKELADRKSIFGICLGLQTIVECFGGKLINLDQPVHGMKKKVKIILEDPLFKNLPPEFFVGLYHSWYVDKSSLNYSFYKTCISDDDMVMAIRHKKYDLCGVLFHPESYMTEYGKEILQNWLRS